MKVFITSLLSVAVAAFVLTSPTYGADEKKKEKGKEKAKKVTMSGTATCGKCDLETHESCINILVVKEGDKKVDYVLAGKAGMDWHKNVCKGSKEVKMTGRVREKDGTKTFVVAKIEE